MIELRGIVKQFGEIYAIHSLEVQIPREKTTVLVDADVIGQPRSFKRRGQ